MIPTLFDVAGIAILGWALMIFLPGWGVTRRIVEWTAFPILISVVYLVGIVIVLADVGPGAVADFGSAEGVVGLLARPDVALVAWIHILAFDHLVGVIIFRDNRIHEVVPLPVQSVILFLTLMFGPVGFLTYWLVRVGRGRGPAMAGPGLAEAEDRSGSGSFPGGAESTLTQGGSQ